MLSTLFKRLHELTDGWIGSGSKHSHAASGRFWRRSAWLAALLAAGLIAGGGIGGPPSSSAAEDCGSLQFLGLAGTGELDHSADAQRTSNMGSTVRDFYDKLHTIYDGSAVTLTGVGIVYPATNV